MNRSACLKLVGKPIRYSFLILDRSPADLCNKLDAASSFWRCNCAGHTRASLNGLYAPSTRRANCPEVVLFKSPTKPEWENWYDMKGKNTPIIETFIAFGGTAHLASAEVPLHYGLKQPREQINKRLFPWAQIGK